MIQHAIDERRMHPLLDFALPGAEAKEQLDRVVGMARHCFRVEYAALVLTDGERVSYESKAGFRGSPELRGLVSSIVDSGFPVMVDNAHLAENRTLSVRFGGVGLGFAAGYPIEAPNGDRIGALCVFGQDPRVTEASDVLMKRDLAMLVQRELWINSVQKAAHEYD